MADKQNKNHDGGSSRIAADPAEIPLSSHRSESRSKWSHPAEFVLSCIGFSVGLGNVWRFPYLCYKNGGAAFLVAYLFLQLTIGKPLYFMELALGQYAAKGPVRIWDFNPAARGVGLVMCIISVNISLYYNVLMAYILYFFFASFSPTLPWDECKKEWGENCINDRSIITQREKCRGDKAIDQYHPNCSKQLMHSARLFFNKEVIQESDNLFDFGYPSWKLALTLLLAWILVIFCMIKGIKTTGKVVYFTATFPYVILLILLVRGLTLDGSGDGVKFFIVPKWEELKNIQLWIDASGQMFYSLGLSMGGILMFGSYNPFHHPVYRDAVIVSTMDLITSVLAGFVIFSTFGYMAKLTGKTILNVARSSYGLAFVAYPETLTTLVLPQLWSVLFFFMLFTLGLDSQFALLETTTTYLIDDFRWCRHHKTKLRLILSLVLYLLGLLLICPGGQYLINIIDIYGSAYPLFVVSLLELVSVMWVYGVNKFLLDLQYMSGRKPRFLAYWYFVWVFWGPIFLISLFFFMVGLSETPVYNDGTKYSSGVMAICWMLYCLTVLPIPLWFFLHARVVYRQHGFTGFGEFIKKVLEPNQRWGPADGTHDMAIKRHTTVWLDVLDWEIFKRPPTESTSTKMTSETTSVVTEMKAPQPMETPTVAMETEATQPTEVAEVKGVSPAGEVQEEGVGPASPPPATAEDAEPARKQSSSVD